MDNLELGTIGSAGCPCGELKTKHYIIEAHCWKSSECKKGCPYACVSYKFKSKKYEQEAISVAKEIQEYISDSYSCDCNLHKI